MRLPKLPILLDHPLLGERASPLPKFLAGAKPVLLTVAYPSPNSLAAVLQTKESSFFGGILPNSRFCGGSMFRPLGLGLFSLCFSLPLLAEEPSHHSQPGDRPAAAARPEITNFPVAEKKLGKADCFDAANWVNACMDKVKRGEWHLRNTLVDVRFPGTNVPPISDRWLAKNFAEILESSDPLVDHKKNSDMKQEGCSSFYLGSDKEAMRFLIESHGPGFVDASLDYDSLKFHSEAEDSELNSELARLFLVASSHEIQLRLEKLSDTSVKMTLRRETDGRFVEQEEVIDCAAEHPNSAENPSPRLSALKERAAALPKFTEEELNKPDERVFAYQNQKGEPIYLRSQTEQTSSEIKQGFKQYSKDKGLTEEIKAYEEDPNYNPVEMFKLADLGHLEHLQKFLQDQGKGLSLETRLGLVRSLSGARLLMHPADYKVFSEDAKRIKELEEGLKLSRERMKAFQKEVSTEAGFPDKLWQWESTPNRTFEAVAKLIGEAMGKAIGSMAEEVMEGIGKELKKLAPKLPPPPPMNEA
jgi:hypothetical protein